MADSISIEETNKIRLALGLPALSAPGAAAASSAGPTFKARKDDSDEEQASTLESRQAEGFANWKQLQDEAQARAAREAKNASIKKARDAAQRFAKLKGKGLGDEADDASLDAKSWLKGQKKRQKQVEKAQKLADELAAREQQAEYTSADLAGVKVGHEIDDFEAGGEQVLTLKDTTIDENEEEGDELEVADLRDKEKLAEELDLKKKKPVYNVQDAAEGKGTLLSQYDEEIDGKKRKRFTLDGKGQTLDAAVASTATFGERIKAQPISLDILNENAPISDYQDISEVKIKKSKKKKSKSARQKTFEDEDEVSTSQNPTANGTLRDRTNEIDNTATENLKRSLDTTSFIDDDDLQDSLASQRRLALKKRKKVKPEDIARQLRNEEEENANAMELDTNNPKEEDGLVIDETTEFIANIQKPLVSVDASHSSRPKAREQDAAMADSDSESDVEMKQELEGSPDAAQTKRELSTPAPDLNATGLGEEASLTNGLGSTLSMLTQRGLLKSHDSGDLNGKYRERQRFLAEKQRREAAAEAKARQQRERDRLSGKLDRMSAREREEHARWENKQRDQQESRQMADVFNKEYKPDVTLKYVDEYGRQMDSKEAFKYLSHQFHGKGSGKGKTEKKLKKIEDEKRHESQSILDSSERAGYDKAMGVTARKNRQAGVRLA